MTPVVTIPPDGPYYDDLTPGHVFDAPPAVTLEDGLAAAYQAIAFSVEAPAHGSLSCRARRP